MQQAISVVDAYAYGALIGTVVMQRLVAPMRGAAADEAAIAQAMPIVETTLRAFDEMLEGAVWLSGGDLGLADLHLAPVMDYFAATPEGRSALPNHPNLQRWWAAMAPRESMAATAPNFG